MHANVMLEYRDKIIEAFTNGAFSSEHLKESDKAAYDYVLEDVKNFIQKIESMAEKINLSLFNEFFEKSPVDYARMLINTKNPNENKKAIAETENKIYDSKDNKRNGRKKNNKRFDETLKIFEKIIDYNKNAQKFFSVASKVDKGKSEPKQKSNQSIPKWVQVSEEIFNFTKLEINENKDLGTTIDNKGYTLNDVNELVNKIAKGKIGKNNASKAYNNLVDKAEQIAAITSTPPRQKILKIFTYLGEIFRGSTGEESATEGKGLKILTPNQMLSRLQISLAHLKAGNNSEKLEHKIRQILHSLYR